MAGDGAPPPFDGEAEHSPTSGTATIAIAADVLHTGELMGAPPLYAVPPIQKPPILGLTAGNVAGEGAKQKPPQYRPQQNGEQPPKKNLAEKEGQQPNTKIQHKQPAIQLVVAVAPVHKAGDGITKTPEHNIASISTCSIGRFRRQCVMNV